MYIVCDIYSFECGYLTPMPFTEETILPPLKGVGTCVEIELALDVWVYVLILSSVGLYIFPYASTTLF